MITTNKKNFCLFGILTVLLCFHSYSCVSGRLVSKDYKLAIIALRADQYVQSSLVRKMPLLQRFPALTEEKLLTILGHFSFYDYGLFSGSASPLFSDKALSYIASRLAVAVNGMKQARRILIVYKEMPPAGNLVHTISRSSMLVWYDKAGLNFFVGEVDKPFVSVDLIHEYPDWYNVSTTVLAVGKDINSISLRADKPFFKKIIGSIAYDNWLILPKDQIDSLQPKKRPSPLPVNKKKAKKVRKMERGETSRKEPKTAGTEKLKRSAKEKKTTETEKLKRSAKEKKATETEKLKRSAKEKKATETEKLKRSAKEKKATETEKLKRSAKEKKATETEKLKRSAKEKKATETEKLKRSAKEKKATETEKLKRSAKEKKTTETEKLKRSAKEKKTTETEKLKTSAKGKKTTGF